MSRGPGHVQRAIVAIYAEQPGKVFSTAELATLIYPGQIITKSNRDAVDRALRQLAPQLGLTRCRSRPWKSTAWRNVWGVNTPSSPLA